MFFDDLGPTKKQSILRVPPPTPETGWRPPREFPNLSGAKVIGFDVERKEYDWGHGPGWRRGKARTVGFSIAAVDTAGNTGAWYFPIRHEVEPQYNLDPQQCMSWLKFVLETPVPKAGANLLYDIGSLTDDGIYVQGELHDCQFAEALLDSDGFVNLEFLGNKYLKRGKETSDLFRWCAEAYGGSPTGDQRLNIWRASPRLVGPYGEADALMPIQILEQQWTILDREELLPVYEMECGLIPLLIEMRLAGVSVDINLAARLYEELKIDIAKLYAKLYELVPLRIDSVESPTDVGRIFDYAHIKYPRIDKGQPSFRKDWLTNLDHPVADLVNEIRGATKARNTFIRNYILQGNIDGKLFCQFHPLRNDEGGAGTGRFASSDPNLQNIPVRTEIGKKIRRAFIPDSGHMAWEKVDFSQIEYRYLAHYAVDKGDGSAERLREAYARDPDTDYHKQTQTNVKELTGFEILRRPIKNMNFGLVFGMSEKKLIRQNNFNQEQGRTVFKAYHTGNPYVRETMRAAEEEMQVTGYITTILGRRIRFNLWEPIDRDYDAPRPMPLPYEQAVREYGSRIKRAHGHKAINARLQGSGTGDEIKMGMYKNYKAGVFKYTGVPRIQVHDELGFSVPDDNPHTLEAYAEMRHILETAIPIRVPVKVDYKRAPNWGDTESE